MKTRIVCVAVCVLGGMAMWGQGGFKGTVVNLATAHWTREANDPPGAESVMLRQDEKTGGMDLLVRFPAGHTFKPHWHDSNERIVVAEGQLTLGQPGGDLHVDAGGTVFLPAKEVQRLSCSSKARCTFYLFWDGNPATHAEK